MDPIVDLEVRVRGLTSVLEDVLLRMKQLKESLEGIEERMQKLEGRD